MSTTTATRRKRRFGVMGVAAAALIGAATIVPASAARVEVVAPISGALNIDGTAAEIPAGSTFTGEWDDEAFTFTGDLYFAPIVSSQTVTTPLLPGVPLDADVTLQISQTGPISGSWDETTGDATASVVLQAAVTRVFVHLGDGIDLGVTNTCVIGPIDLNLTGTAVPDAEGNPVLTLNADQFTIPAAAAGSCATTGAVETDITDAVNGALAGQNNTATVSVSLAQGQDIPEETTTTVPETTTTVPGETTTTVPGGGNGGTGGTPPASGAAPISGSANYTG